MILGDEIGKRILQDTETEEIEVKKSDLTTGKWLNFEIGVKEYELEFDAAKGIFFVVNDEFGLNASKYGTLETAGIDIAVFAYDVILHIQTMLLFFLAYFNI